MPFPNVAKFSKPPHLSDLTRTATSLSGTKILTQQRRMYLECSCFYIKYRLNYHSIKYLRGFASFSKRICKGNLRCLLFMTTFVYMEKIS